MPRRARLVVGARVALFAALLAVSPARAGTSDASISTGTTFRVNGNPGSGGAAVSLAMLWPFEGRWAFGVVAHADDMGTDMTELFDPNTGQSLGTIGELHRWGYGVSWRGEALLAQSGRWQVRWGADFGYMREEADLRGDVVDAVSGVAVATGPALLWRLTGGHSIGLAGAWKHAFVNTEQHPDRTTDWASLAFQWRWQGTAKE